MTLRPDGWQGTGFSDLHTVQNLLEALLNRGIPVRKHLYKEVILSNRMQPTQKLTPEFRSKVERILVKTVRTHSQAVRT
jgi:hypothetical protein